MAGIKGLLVVWTAVGLVIEATSSNTAPPSTARPPITAQALAKIVEERLDSTNYNSRMRPGIHEDPVDVYININVNDISYISETQMEYSMTLFIRQIWIDERLAYEETGYDRNITLNYMWLDRFWTPDLYIVNLKSGVFHTITVPNRRFKLSPNGQVYYSQQLTVTLYCDMMLERFPMDNQTCFIELGTYAFTTDDLVFHWRLDADAVVITRVFLPEYTITNITSIDCTPTIKGAYPCLRAYFHLNRRLKKYLLSTYLPSFLVVLLSWVSFFIDPESTPARASLGITSVLVITTQTSGLVSSVPPGSVTKASDVWMSTCLVFVFGAFIEYAAVNYLTSRKKQMKVEDVDHLTKKAKVVGSECKKSSSEGIWSLLDFKGDPAMTLERISRFLFPFTFFLFCLIYWPTYLVG